MQYYTYTIIPCATYEFRLKTRFVYHLNEYSRKYLRGIYVLDTTICVHEVDEFIQLHNILYPIGCK